MLNLLVDCFLPPFGFVILALLLLAVGGRRARGAAAFLLLLTVLLGIPPVPAAMLNAIAPPTAAPGPEPGAIVILSADGVRLDGPVDLGPGLLTLDRLRAGAQLARQSHLPVLVSGGSFLGSHTSLGEMMAISLRDDFAVPVRWTEDGSKDTWQNAEYSAAILKRAGITRVYVVTHFWHMRRALIAFRAFGLDPVPAPVRPPQPFPIRNVADVLPRSTAWYDAYLASHEWIGWAYYSLR